MTGWDTNLLIDTAKRLFRDEFEPRAAALDTDPDQALPEGLVSGLGDAGLLDAGTYDDSVFGTRPSVELLLAVSADCPTYGALLAMGLLGGYLHHRWGDGAPPATAALCFWENHQSSPAVCDTRIRDGRINGSKSMTLFAPRAQRLAVLCTTGEGPNLAWIDAAEEGVAVENRRTLGLRALGCGQIHLHRAPAMGITPLKTADPLEILDRYSLYTTACALGAADHSLQVAGEYAAQRYQGGRMIEAYDAVRLLLDNGRASVDAAIGALKSLATVSPEEPRSAGECLRFKAHAARVAVAAASDSLQVLGGYGYMRDYGQERRFRDICTLMLYPLDPTRSLLWAGSPELSGSCREAV